jgi:hypothetical protein
MLAGIQIPELASASGARLEVALTPTRFGIEDVAQLVVKVIEPPSELEQPSLGELTNLEVVRGPSRGTEFSFINGVASSAVSFSYLVRGLDVGPASVGPISVTVDDEQLAAELVNAEIVPGSVAPPRPSRRNRIFEDPFESLFQRRRGPRPKVVLRQLLSADSAVVGEPVLATVVLDTTHRVSGYDFLALPSYPGWWAQRVDPSQQPPPEAVEIDGVGFSRFVIARHVLVPLKAGVLVVPEVQMRIGVGSQSFFDTPEVVERSSAELEVRVGQRPLPPEGYAGAVGRLNYEATLEPAQIDFGASAVLTITVSGTGNLPLVEAPVAWPGCSGCESYPPEEESRITVGERGIRGSRSWRKTVVPREWGSLIFEPVVASVFDPNTGSYRQQTLGPLSLEVRPPPPTPTPTVDQTAAEGVGKARDGEGARVQEDGVPASWMWVVGALLAGLGLGGLLVWLAGRRRSAVIPPQRPGQSPAERARELQLALERWWLDVKTRGPREGAAEEMERLRRDLEAVRFAPGRADHSETVKELEGRFRSLLKRA